MAAKKNSKRVGPGTRRELEELRKGVDTAERKFDSSADLPKVASPEPAQARTPAPDSSPKKFQRVVDQEEGKATSVQTSGPAEHRGPGRPPKPKPELVPSAPLPEAIIDQSQCKYLLEMVGQFNTLAVSLFLKIPPIEAGNIWRFNATELAALAPPATQVINKRAPEWLRKYADEFALVIILLPILIAKMAATIAVRSQMRQQAAAQAEAEASAPAKTNGSGKPESEMAA